MGITSSKRKNTYQPILNGVPNWPVYQLSKNRKEFLDEVFHASVARIKELRPTRSQLIDEIEATIYREQKRMKRNKWRVDSPDDKLFWSKIKRDLVELGRKNNNGTTGDDIIGSIVYHYTQEIAGNFKPSSYRFARGVIKFWFLRLLNGSQVKKFGAIFRSQYKLEDKIFPIGKIDMLRKLAQQGTVVIVPTHFSNLDSITVSWIIHFLGLPPFIYGAGLNLFNIKIFAYFMNSLGVYKIDRRKKNLFYLETLKMYSTLALQHGAHSLFFPGGTRSRSGSIETRLQLGLLSTTIEAQRHILMKRGNNTDKPFRKIFIVPVTLNYHFVLEAPNIIEDYLHKQGLDRYFPEHDKYGSFQLLKFLFKFFTKGSNISVSIGPGMDVLGNHVDEKGNSLDAQGRTIEIEDYFVSNGEIVVDHQRTKEYTRILSQHIVDEYHRIGCVYASHLVAFVAFKMWQKQYPKLDLFDLLRMPEEDMHLSYEDFKKTFSRVCRQIKKMEREDKLVCADHLKGDSDEAIVHGLSNVGVFHVKRPLLKDKKNRILTHNLTTLFYYHNRLMGYGLESFI